MKKMCENCCAQKFLCGKKGSVGLLFLKPLAAHCVNLNVQDAEVQSCATDKHHMFCRWAGQSAQPAFQAVGLATSNERLHLPWVAKGVEQVAKIHQKKFLSDSATGNERWYIEVLNETM